MSFKLTISSAFLTNSCEFLTNSSAFLTNSCWFLTNEELRSPEFLSIDQPRPHELMHQGNGTDVGTKNESLKVFFLSSDSVKASK